MTGYLVDFEQLEWTSPLPSVRHKVQRVGGNILRLVEYSPTMVAHWSEGGHLGSILAGRVEIKFAGETLEFAAGDGVAIPSGVENRHHARLPTEVVRALFIEEL